MASKTSPNEYVTVRHGIRGYFASYTKVSEEGLHEPHISSETSHKTPDKAELEARSWAKADGIPFIPHRPSKVTPSPADAAVGISEDDIAAVLRETAKAKASQVDDLAVTLLPKLDQGLIAMVAIEHSTDLDEQTAAAHEEILRQLYAIGVIDDLAGETDTSSGFVVGRWTHLFGPGSHETTCLIAYDRSNETLVAAMAIEKGRQFYLTSGDLADLEDSLKNANHESIERPADAGLELVASLPEWATAYINQSHKQADRPRG